MKDMENNQYAIKPAAIVTAAFALMIASLSWGALTGHEIIANLVFYFSFSCLILLLGFTNHPHKPATIVYVLIAGFSIYYIFFIIRASMVIKGVRYFSLFEDMMISMRYAKNFAMGYGLTWNPGGARVEGFTNFLWTLYMAFWHLFLSEAKVSLPIQLTGLLLFVASIFLVRRIAEDISGKNSYVVIGAVFLTASYQPLYYLALKGVETSAVGFIMLLAVWRVFTVLKHDSFDPWVFVLLGVSFLIRPDVIPLYLGFSLFLAFAGREHRAKYILCSALILMVTFAGTSLFRWLYFGDVLPNTYYLKLTGFPLALRITKGLEVTHYFIKSLSYFLCVVVMAFSFMHINNKKIRLLVFLIAIQLVYNIYAGGDAWEWGVANRYVCIIMPLFFILLCSAAYQFIQAFERYSNINAVFKKTCYTVLLVIVVLQLHNGYQNNVDFPCDNLLKALIKFPDYEIDIDKICVKTGLALRDLTSPDAKIAGPAGAESYFADRYSVDLLGKTDSYIARQKSKIQDAKEFRPGHNKWDFPYSIVECQPDIVTYIDRAFLDSPEKRQYFVEHYDRFEFQGYNPHKELIFCRKNSHKLNWAMGSVVNKWKILSEPKS
jgi:arabinofuranosyltransferase